MGLVKKAEELAVLCGCRVGVVIASDAEGICKYTSDDVDDLLESLRDKNIEVLLPGAMSPIPAANLQHQQQGQKQQQQQQAAPLTADVKPQPPSTSEPSSRCAGPPRDDVVEVPVLMNFFEPHAAVPQPAPFFFGAAGTVPFAPFRNGAESMADYLEDGLAASRAYHDGPVLPDDMLRL